MNRLQLTLACRDYDRTRALASGAVRADGIELNVLSPPIDELFRRAQQGGEFDVAEMPLAAYAASLAAPRPPFIGLPVFPSRYFVHGALYVRGDSPWHDPRELRGRRIGTPDYGVTGTIWLRGLLADDYALPVDSVEHVVGPLESQHAGSLATPLPAVPASIRIQRADAGRSLVELLEAGSIDAIASIRPPSGLGGRSAPGARVRRLFADHVTEEADWFGRRAVLPIHHVFALRRDVYEAHRWVAQSLCKALIEAHVQALRALCDPTALPAALPWLAAFVAQTRDCLGEDWWPVGLQRGQANERALSAFLRYRAEQGLAKEVLAPAALFAPETLEGFVI